MPTFHTNCTLPSHTVNYVTAPNTRGTLQILWSCLGTLVLCTWTVQHLNIPQQSVPQTTVQSLTRRVWRFTRKLKWMLLTLIAPEYVLGKAFSDLLSARRHLPEYEKFAEIDGVAWSTGHTFLANMGGFAIDFSDTIERPRSTASSPKQPTDDGPAAIELQHLRENIGPASRRDTQQRATNISPSTSRSSQASRREPISKRAPENEPQANSDSIASNEDEVHFHPDSTLGALASGPGFATVDNDPASPEASPKELELLECAVRPKQEFPTDTLLGSEYQTQIQDYLRRIGQSRRHGVQNCIRSESKDSSAIGKTDWYPDEHNTNLVSSALDQTQLSDFPTAWERWRYLRRHRTWYSNLTALQGNIWVLDACQLLLARKMGILNRLPKVSEDRVDDCNKSDFLVKGLAVGQVLWLFVQLVARAHKSIVPSQLEIVVLAFAVCTFAMYLLLWNKPQDVRAPMYVPASRYPSADEMSRLAIAGPDIFSRYRTRHWIPNNTSHCDGSRGQGPHSRMAIAAVLGATIFGGLHCAAWNLQFPTPVERLLWRIAAVITAGVPPVAVATNILLSRLLHGSTERNTKYSRRPLVIVIWSMAVFVLPYGLARVFITVEIFRSLCFLDPETFITTWASNIPHVS